MGLILDTSVLVAEERGRFRLWDFCEAQFPEALFITALTASELLHGVERAMPGPVRDRRRQQVEGVIADFQVLDFDLDVARRHAAVWAHLTVAGTPIGPHDLLIAATALYHGFALATLNASEFRRVPGLVLTEVQAFLVTPA
ncbi:MAG: type II toxin-antitoxin system VapC family toxin [Opitutus sp.]|nr:type II toxin-antitoxin system VapC family toxin [Opitutus sp.]